MRRTLSLTSLVFTSLFAISLLAGCTPKYIRGTKIEYQPQKQEIADLIERYRVALESKDISTLNQIASDRYYENGSTTNDPSDDYDYAGLTQVLDQIDSQVKAVKYQLKITSIDILKNTASVDVDYTGQFLFTHNEQDRWSTHADKNRITLKRDPQGAWKIVSGL
jgi:hypothetical protein